MTQTVWYWASVLFLTLMLFLPVSNLVWVVSVRRLQGRERRELAPAELTGQKRRARFVAFFVSFAFSLLFCQQLIGGAG